MKKMIYPSLFLAFLFLTVNTFAQSDTLLYEDFQGDVEPYMLIFPDDYAANDTTWINWDAEQEADANSRPQNWYQAVDFAAPDSIAPNDTNVVMASSSWLSNFDATNVNWLITPPIQIVDDQATLHWKSAPFQGPRYMDGYKVLISANSFDPYYGGFSDTLFTASQMLTPLPDGASDPEDDALEIDSFLISEGYAHADRFMLTEYFTIDSGDNIYTCLLEPHSLSLADYEGETIYIAFLHDSQDDNLISIDDILVLGTNPATSTNILNLPDIRLVTYPNPVQNYLNVMYRLEEAAQIQMQITDMNGKLISAGQILNQVSGEHHLQIDMRKLPAGTYSMLLNVDGNKYSRKIIRK